MTPRWMLVSETGASAASATLGAVALRASRSEHPAPNGYECLGKMAAATALLLHAARVAVYLKRRGSLAAAENAPATAPGY